MQRIDIDTTFVFFIADKLNLFVNKIDNTKMCDCLQLNTNTDSIDNYEEKQFSEEEYNELIKTIYGSIRD